MKSGNVALVLSSGGARGLAHIGAIRAIQEAGFTITSVAGTSMGALVGATLANGNLKGFSDFMTGLSRVDVLRLMDLAVSKKGIIKGEKVFGEIAKFIGDYNIEDLPIPFTAVATDLFNHREVIFRHGSLITALRASAAVPTVLFPVYNNETYLVDGAVVNPLPIDRVERTESDLLMAINVNAPRQTIKKKKLPEEHTSYSRFRSFVNTKWNGVLSSGEKEQRSTYGFFDIISASFEMMQLKITETALRQQQVDLLINLPVNLADMFEFYRAYDLIEAGYKATKAGLARNGSIPPNENGIVQEWFV